MTCEFKSHRAHKKSTAVLVLRTAVLLWILIYLGELAVPGGVDGVGIGKQDIEAVIGDLDDFT